MHLLPANWGFNPRNFKICSFWRFHLNFLLQRSWETLLFPTLSPGPGGWVALWGGTVAQRPSLSISLISLTLRSKAWGHGRGPRDLTGEGWGQAQPPRKEPQGIQKKSRPYEPFPLRVYVSLLEVWSLNFQSGRNSKCPASLPAGCPLRLLLHVLGAPRSRQPAQVIEEPRAFLGSFMFPTHDLFSFNAFWIY